MDVKNILCDKKGVAFLNDWVYLPQDFSINKLKLLVKLALLGAVTAYRQEFHRPTTH
jgi:hypothetical protein